jgi:hypothetical protein
MASASQLRAKIPGWGADLDPKNRPAVPKEKTPPQGTGAHWDEPEQQIPTTKILVSVEHAGLTPVFGTACPLKGLSGKIREFAFRFSEGRKLHWLLLLFADRVDVIEEAGRTLLKLDPHNPLSEMGLQTEFRRGGFFSRFGEGRSDVRRQKRELLLIAGIGAGAYLYRQAKARRAA